MGVEYQFEKLEDAPLVIDAVYKCGTAKNLVVKYCQIFCPELEMQGDSG